MKYLKTYKLFENIEVVRELGYQSIFSDEFISTLKDFCLDLSDKEYKVNIHECTYEKSDEKYKSIAIDIDSYYGIKYELFENTLQLIRSFCEENDFKLDVEIVKENEFLSCDEFVEYCEGDDFSQLSIIIYQQSPQQ